MKMYFKRTGALLLCAAMLAGCSSTPASSTQPSTADSTKSSETSTSKTTSTVEKASLLEQLVAASNSDADAEKIWMDIFQQTVDAYKGNVETEGDGEMYEYQTDGDTNFIENDAHQLYDNGRKSGFVTTDNEVWGSDLISIDDMYNNMIDGAGLFSSITADRSTTAVTSLTDTKNDHLAGQVQSIVENAYSKDTFAAINLRDAVINCGYARTVDPVHDASLYTFDLAEKGTGYELTLKIKDLEQFKTKAASLTVLTDNLMNEPILGLDEVTEENFVFHFDKQGVLKSVDNNVFHAIYTRGEKLYVNVRNETDVEALEDPNEFQSIVGDFMSQITDKKLTEGSNFDITDWK